MKHFSSMLNLDKIIFYSKVIEISFYPLHKHNLFKICIFISVFDNKKFKDDNFLGQCELPIVPSLPEQKPDSPINLGEKDCVLRLLQEIKNILYQNLRSSLKF